MDPSRVDVVLVRPSRAANVAAACRAMKNMGLRRLHLVDPPADSAGREARGLAYGAWDVLDDARVSADLRQAVAEATLVVGTSGRPHPDAWTPRRLAEEGNARAGAGRVAIVFGPEASGLRREELNLCHLTVHIPADPAQPSLNLAQAVLIVAYEIYLSGRAREPDPPEARATAGEVEGALADLALGLVGIGYLNPQNPEAILAEIRRLITRAGPMPREVALLRGLARQVLWASRHLSRDPPPCAEPDAGG